MYILVNFCVLLWKFMIYPCSYLPIPSRIMLNLITFPHMEGHNYILLSIYQTPDHNSVKSKQMDSDSMPETWAGVYISLITIS